MDTYIHKVVRIKIPEGIACDRIHMLIYGSTEIDFYFLKAVKNQDS